MRDGLSLASVEGRNVLLVLRQWEQPGTCAVNALQLALDRGASLEVLRVLPGPSYARERPSFMESQLLKDERRVVRADTLNWLQNELGGAARHVRVVVAQGDFAEQVARRAKMSNVGLITVSREAQQSGALITSIARTAERPVLAPNHLMEGRPILAATDMRDSRYPVLWQAAQLANELRAPLVAFHNSEPPSPETAPSRGSSAGSPLERLLDVTSLLPTPTIATVRSEQDTVRAILNEAAAVGASAIAVGTRCRSWWRRAFCGSVAAEVTERSKLAVLVTPIGFGHGAA
jgi:nucleotide-binding universal stress UspA family protein